MCTLKKSALKVAFFPLGTMEGGNEEVMYNI